MTRNWNHFADYDDHQQEAYDDGVRDGQAGYDSGEHAYPLIEKDAYAHGFQVGSEDPDE